MKRSKQLQQASQDAAKLSERLAGLASVAEMQESSGDDPCEIFRAALQEAEAVAAAARAALEDCENNYQ